MKSLKAVSIRISVRCAPAKLNVSNVFARAFSIHQANRSSYWSALVSTPDDCSQPTRFGGKYALVDHTWPHASAKEHHKLVLLAQVARAWKDSVIHIFDRDYGNSTWLTLLIELNCHFIVR